MELLRSSQHQHVDDLILTTGDAAKLLSLSAAGVHWLVSQGRLHATRTASRQLLFRKSEVLRLVAERDAAAHAPGGARCVAEPLDAA